MKATDDIVELYFITRNWITSAKIFSKKPLTFPAWDGTEPRATTPLTIRLFPFTDVPWWVNSSPLTI